MHRITRLDLDATRTRLRIEGRLLTSCLPSIQQACSTCLSAGRALEIDLAGVEHMEEPVAAALRALRRRGVAVSGASAYIEALLAPPR
jgi:hypothetical protein